MFSDPDGLINNRMKALNVLKKGEEDFAKSKSGENKLKAYQLYKKGIEMMINYAKNEQNPLIITRLKQKIKEWLTKAENMQNQIYPSLFQGGITPNQNPQSNLGPRTRFESHDEPLVVPKQPCLFPRDNKKIQPNEADSKLINNLQDTLLVEKPNVRWEDIVGLEQAKNTLREAVIYPIRFPQLFVGNRTPWKGILLYGPPGTGKTYLAKACATEAQATFFSVSSADIMSKYVGESEKLVKNMFTLARQNKPAIIFIDEIDSLLSSRKDDENEAFRRVKTEFLVQMQGLGKDDTGILLLGATNRPWDLDPAVRRRFEKRIYIPLPNRSARRALLMKQFEKTPHALRSEDIEYLAIKTEGFSGADINILVRDACFEPIRKAQNATHFRVIDTLPNGLPVYQPCHPQDTGAQAMVMYNIPGPQLRLKSVGLEDFEVALQKTKPSVGVSDLALQEKFTRDYGIEG